MATTIAAPSKADANISTTTPSQDYIDQLQEKLNDAERELSLASERTKNAQHDFDIANAWFMQVKTYRENIEATDQLADEVMKILTSFEDQSTLVGTNADYNVQAIKLLVLKAKETSDSTEELKALMKNLLDKLDCISDPGLDKNVSIMALVSTLKDAIDAALLACIESIKSCLSLLQCALNIKECIQGENGLTENIKNMDSTLRTGESEELEDEDLRALGRRPTFPLTDCDRDYYDRIQQLFTYTEDQIKDGATGNKKHKLEEAKNRKTMAQSNHDALKGALEAAQAAKTC